MLREQRRYRAHMPEAARKAGREPRLRASRKSAVRDLHEGLQRYLIARGPLYPLNATERDRTEVLAATAAWAAWAVQLGYPHLPTPRAPDGTSWGINTVIDYV